MKRFISANEPSVELIVAYVADDFLLRTGHGEVPDIEAYAGRFPRHATVIRQVLASIDLVRLAATACGTWWAEVQGVLRKPEAWETYEQQSRNR